jgi:hypothetical protein
MPSQEENVYLAHLLDKIDEIQKDVAIVKVEVAQHKMLFGDHLEQDKRMAEDIKHIVDNLNRVDAHLNEYNRQLEIHIAGVEELKTANKLHKQDLDLHKEEIRKEILELQKPRVVVKGIMWFVGALTSVGGLIWVIQNLFF